MYINAITRKTIVKQLLWRHFFFGIYRCSQNTVTGNWAKSLFFFVTLICES